MTLGTNGIDFLCISLRERSGRLNVAQQSAWNEQATEEKTRIVFLMTFKWQIPKAASYKNVAKNFGGTGYTPKS